MFNVQFSIKEIREEGRKEGMKEGRKESAIEIARNLLLKGMSIKDISDTTGLDEELIKHLDERIDEGTMQPV